MKQSSSRSARTKSIAAGLWAVACFVFVPLPALSFQVLLEVDLPAGTESALFTDDDLDGVIAFDTTVGGAFYAKGEVKQDLNPILKQLTIAPTSPDAAAIFRNVDSASRAFRVTVTSDAFDPELAAPVGWNIFYNATAGDAFSGVVDIPSHSVKGQVNAGALLLGEAAGSAISAVSAIELEASAIDPTNAAADMTILFSFTAGPQDEFLVPTDGGFDGTSIQFEVFNQDQRCVDKMNNDARNVANKAYVSDYKCIAQTESSDVATCVDEPQETKTEQKETKLLEHFTDLCDPVPAWGVNRRMCCNGGSADGALCSGSLPCAGGGTCTPGACISTAAENGVSDLAHDLFGASVNVGADQVQKCQIAVSRFAGLLLVERWKVFRLCKRDGFAAILDDGDLISTCLGPPQPDPKTKIDKKRTKLTQKIQKACLEKGVTPVGGSFPGACTSSDDATFDDCVDRLVACRFCRSVNRADAILPALACDVFDNGLTDSSCSP
ncbi:MAG: hypothetical protein HY899_09560 [Deltaproteobacteria bacterium]|nr:hypothetical protein [Deltaproteobacteria bacterium]